MRENPRGHTLGKHGSRTSRVSARKPRGLGPGAFHRSDSASQWEGGAIALGGFHTCSYPKMDGLKGKIPLKWMFWGYPYFRKALFEFNQHELNMIELEEATMWIFQR